MSLSVNKDNHCTHIIFTAILVGGSDELGTYGLRVRSLVKNISNLRIAYHLPQTIRTAQEDIPRMHLLSKEINLHVLFISNATEYLVALWMCVYILWLNKPTGHQLPNQRMIVRQLIELLIS